MAERDRCTDDETGNPTPQEIGERCLEIQSEWSPRQREARIVGRGDRVAWSVPVVKDRKRGTA